VEELEMILTSADRKTGISEDNKLASFFERKSMNQKAEANERERKKAEKGVQKGSSKLILGAVILVVLILVVYFLF
jgi:hypothetical protein